MASISPAGSSTMRIVVKSSRRPVKRPSQCRSFSSSSQCLAQTAMVNQRMDLGKLMPKQQSTAARMKQVKRSEIPTDVGLIPGTFIRPTSSESPSYLSSRWRERLSLDYTSFLQTRNDFFSKYYTYRWQSTDPRTGKKIKKPLQLRERAFTAMKLHRELYSAIAAGDGGTIQAIACSGLAQQQITRINRRKAIDAPREAFRVSYPGIAPRPDTWWLLQCLNPFKPVKIVADRIIDLPFADGCTVRQVTCRIKSTQTLDKHNGTQPVKRKMSEYFVIQQLIMTETEKTDGAKPAKGKNEGWKVWGTVQPGGVAEAKKWKEFVDLQKGAAPGFADQLQGLTSQYLK